jgi:molybdate transport system substrate-binding protein
MLSSLKRVALVATAVAAVCGGTAQAATTTITVGASPSIANALVDLIGGFQAFSFASGLSYNIAVTVDTNQNLEAGIISSATPAFDLLLTDDVTTIADLTKNYAGYVQGAPFVFGYDTLFVYSQNLNVSGVSTGLPEEFKGQVVIPDPTSDAYGVAAASLLLRDPWEYLTVPSKKVAVQPDSSTVRAGVELGVYPIGVLANSAICSALSGVPSYPDGSSVHQLASQKGSVAKVALTGLATTVATRTAAQSAELTAFTNFLTGVGTTQGTDVLQRSCYSLQ